MRLLLGLLMAGLLVPVSGCFQCVPQLDVRNCTPRVGGCDPGTAEVIAWDPAAADLWPDVARFIARVEPGTHEHADWRVDQAEAFWTFYQVPEGDGVHRQVFLSDHDDLFRVRVLPC